MAAEAYRAPYSVPGDLRLRKQDPLWPGLFPAAARKVSSVASRDTVVGDTEREATLAEGA